MSSRCLDTIQLSSLNVTVLQIKANLGSSHLILGTYSEGFKIQKSIKVFVLIHNNLRTTHPKSQRINQNAYRNRQQ